MLIWSWRRQQWWFGMFKVVKRHKPMNKSSLWKGTPNKFISKWDYVA